MIRNASGLALDVRSRMTCTDPKERMHTQVRILPVNNTAFLAFLLCDAWFCGMIMLIEWPYEPERGLRLFSTRKRNVKGLHIVRLLKIVVPTIIEY